MDPLHQIIYLEAQVGRPSSVYKGTSYQYQQEMVITATGETDDEMILDGERVIKTVNCPAGQKLCDSMSIFSVHDVLYETYHLTVEFIHPGDFVIVDGEPSGDDDKGFLVHFRMNFINKEFTKWQIGWKVIFCIITLAVMFFPVDGLFGGFFYKLRKTKWSNWSDMQVWLASLLAMLFIFNDPLFPIEVYTESGVLLAALYIVFLCAYLSVMMFFWLCIMHETSLQGGVDAEQPKTTGFYIFKAIFCTAFWILLSVTYIFIRLKQQGDPAYDALDDTSHYKMFTTVLTVFMAIYMGWLTFYFLNALGQARRLSKPFIFLFCFSFSMIIFSMVCLAIGAMYPLPSASWEYLVFYGMTNTYVWVLAWAYSPSDSDSIHLTEDVSNERGTSRGLSEQVEDSHL